MDFLIRRSDVRLSLGLLEIKYFGIVESIFPIKTLSLRMIIKLNDIPVKIIHIVIVSSHETISGTYINILIVFEICFAFDNIQRLTDVKIQFTS